jgi:hypothetical protein
MLCPVRAIARGSFELAPCPDRLLFSCFWRHDGGLATLSTVHTDPYFPPTSIVTSWQAFSDPAAGLQRHVHCRKPGQCHNGAPLLSCFPLGLWLYTRVSYHWPKSKFQIKLPRASSSLAGVLISALVSIFVSQGHTPGVKFARMMDSVARLHSRDGPSSREDNWWPRQFLRMSECLEISFNAEPLAREIRRSRRRRRPRRPRAV